MIKKILLLPSVLITKGLIALHIKVTASELKKPLNYLVEKQWLTNDKYLMCGKRQIEAFLKYVPANIEDRTVKYLLQRRLLDIDVKVDEYIESLKLIKFASTSQRPSSLLLMTLKETPYDQFNIQLLRKRKPICMLHCSLKKNFFIKYV